MTNAIHWPEWVPMAGHHLRVSGVHFDAVRIQGAQGEVVAARLIAEARGDAGPVIREMSGARWMYFLVAPGTVEDHAWPLGVQRFGMSRTVTYIGVPALAGNTWPLGWYSEPTPATPYVEPERLLAALGVVDV
ncbi:hypothetical protein [Streptomyces longisporoflavus]|uniref:hypothetical protein n=1 Tax=Streptomyces longisporoflavus TaxID=28044 RepID=UPI001E41C5CF|nr:hypothetical protein [Streptomyces longisporoflavus]